MHVILKFRFHIVRISNLQSTASPLPSVPTGRATLQGTPSISMPTSTSATTFRHRHPVTRSTSCKRQLSAVKGSTNPSRGIPELRQYVTPPLPEPTPGTIFQTAVGMVFNINEHDHVVRNAVMLVGAIVVASFTWRSYKIHKSHVKVRSSWTPVHIVDYV
jgi:hypothetical protein